MLVFGYEFYILLPFTFDSLDARMFIPSLLCLLFVYLMLGIMLVSSVSPMTHFQYSCLCVFPKLLASLFPAGPEIIYEQFLLLFMLLCIRLRWVAGFSHFPDKIFSSLSHSWDLLGNCWSSGLLVMEKLKN